MNLNEQNPVFPLLAPSTNAPDFFAECAEFGKAIFARLRSHFQTPPGNRSESPDTIRELDSASRILKRLQEAYLAAQREMQNQAKQKHPERGSASKTLPASASPPDIALGVAPSEGDLQKGSYIETPKALDIRAQGQSEATTLGYGEHLYPTLKGLDKSIEPASAPADKDPLGAVYDPSTITPASLPSAPVVSAPAPWPLPKPPSAPFRPPLSRNQKKAAHRKSKHKR